MATPRTRPSVFATAVLLSLLISSDRPAAAKPAQEFKDFIVGGEKTQATLLSSWESWLKSQVAGTRKKHRCGLIDRGSSILIAEYSKVVGHDGGKLSAAGLELRIPPVFRDHGCDPRRFLNELSRNVEELRVVEELAREPDREVLDFKSYFAQYFVKRNRVSHADVVEACRYWLKSNFRHAKEDHCPLLFRATTYLNDYVDLGGFNHESILHLLNGSLYHAVENNGCSVDRYREASAELFRKAMDAKNQGIMLYTQSVVNVRSGASLDESVLFRIGRGVKVEVHPEQSVTADGYTWVIVKSDGRQGWSARELLADHPPPEAVRIAESCFQLGIRYGRCATRAFLGKKCSAQDDIEKPERCMSDPSFEKGLEVGAREAMK